MPKDSSVVMAVDLGATNLRVGFVAVNKDGEPKVVYQKVERTVSDDRQGLIDQIIKLANKVVDEKPDIHFTKIGVDACGLINNDRTAKLLPNLHVRNVPLADALEKAFPYTKVKVANDANASALSEYTFGASKGTECSVFVTISSGIGGGLVYQGKLINTPMECGRLAADYEGKPVELEEYLSGNGIRRLCKKIGLGDMEAKEFFAKLRKGSNDKILTKAYADWLRYMGCFFSNLQKLFDCDCYVLSGGVWKSKDVFEEDLLKVSAAYLHPYPLKPIVLRDAEFGQDSGIMGAAAVGFSIEDTKVIAAH